MEPTQLYETTIHNRDTGESFSFITVPRRSFLEPPENARGGIGEGLQIGLRAKVLRLIGVRDPDEPEQ